MGFYLYLIHALMFSCGLTYVSCDELDEAVTEIMLEQVEHYRSGKEKRLNEVEFALFTEKTVYVSPAGSPGKLHDGHLRKGSPLKILIHGWLRHHKNKGEFEVNFNRGYIGKDKNVQVVSVRWLGGTKDYITARRSVPLVGEAVFNYFHRLKSENNVDLKNVTCLGHGLGAQICGSVGHMFSGELGTVIAMDPMAPLFWQNTINSVNKTSAKKVIGVHTSAGTFGVIWNVGHVDFWAGNGMAPQIDCMNKEPKEQIRCSHKKSYDYFLETIKDKYAVEGTTCGRKRHFCKKVNEEPPAKAYMEEGTTATGQYCFIPPKITPFPTLEEIMDELDKTNDPVVSHILNSTTTSKPPFGDSGEGDNPGTFSEDGKEAGKQDPTEAGKQDPTEAGKHHPTEAGKQDPTEAGKQDPTEAGKQDPTEAGKKDPMEAGKQDPEEGENFPVDEECVEMIKLHREMKKNEAVSAARSLDGGGGGGPLPKKHRVRRRKLSDVRTRPSRRAKRRHRLHGRRKRASAKRRKARKYRLLRKLYRKIDTHEGNAFKVPGISKKLVKELCGDLKTRFAGKFNARIATKTTPNNH